MLEAPIIFFSLIAIIGIVMTYEGYKRAAADVDGGRRYVMGWIGIALGSSLFAFGVVQLIEALAL